MIYCSQQKSHAKWDLIRIWNNIYGSGSGSGCETKSDLFEREKFCTIVQFIFVFVRVGSSAGSGSGITLEIGSGSGLGINHTDSQHRETGSGSGWRINHTDSQHSGTVQYLYKKWHSQKSMRKMQEMHPPLFPGVKVKRPLFSVWITRGEGGGGGGGGGRGEMDKKPFPGSRSPPTYSSVLYSVHTLLSLEKERIKRIPCS